MQYFDSRNQTEFTQSELLAICKYQLKPYPEGWYKEEEEILLNRNQALEEEYLEGISIEQDEENWYEDISMATQRWQNLFCWR